MLCKIIFRKEQFPKLEYCHHFMQMHKIEMNEIDYEDNEEEHIFIINKLEINKVYQRIKFGLGVIFVFC